MIDSSESVTNGRNITRAWGAYTPLNNVVIVFVCTGLAGGILSNIGALQKCLFQDGYKCKKLLIRPFFQHFTDTIDIDIPTPFKGI